MVTFLDALEHQFMQNALMAGLLAAVVFGVIGTYVVVRRVVFIAGGIAHASFGGVGLAIYLGWSNPILGAAIVAIMSALGIGVLNREDLEREETTIGIVWATGMALGAFFYQLTPGYKVSPASYLFGNIILLTDADIYWLAILVSVVLVTVVLFFNQIQAVAFDEEFAEVVGLPAFLFQLYMLVLVACTIVLLIKFLGIILVLAMLAIPPSIAGQFTHDMRKIMVAAAGLAVLFIVTGLWISFELDYQTGATIVLEAALAYLMVIGVKRGLMPGFRSMTRKLKGNAVNGTHKVRG